LARIEEFKSIEGIASDVRQAHTTVTVNGRIEGNSYECLFRVSGAPVALRVSNPIFIEDGETVRVVGIHNGNGVFDAVAYYNRSSRASGMSASVWSRQDHAMIYAISGALFAFLVVTFAVWANFKGIGVVLFGSLGLVLALYSLRLFARYRSERREIERLLREAHL
jgi:hypothetical protein